MNRRDIIKILSAATLGSLVSCRKADSLQTFSAVAFGTEVNFQTHGISEASFMEICQLCSKRLQEIESLFSLYDADSTISKLNRDGQLTEPSPEFLKLIRLALDYGDKTKGIFDISVQPLWNWRQEWKSADLKQREIMEKTTWEIALSLVDYREIQLTENSVKFGKSGMAITLNAIAQGYATDQIIAILKENGISNALVNIGEYAAIGNSPDSSPWEVELSANQEKISLSPGTALAVSAGSGYTFEPEGRLHHIFRPSDGVNLRPLSTIVVTAPNATTADALSTSLSIANESERQAILEKFPNTTFREVSL